MSQMIHRAVVGSECWTRHSEGAGLLVWTVSVEASGQSDYCMS